jgi:transposase
MRKAVITSDTSVHLPTDFVPLTDCEWQALAPLLPPERAQLNAMSNRDFLDAVLQAMARSGRWTARGWSARKSESVRRRFSRWARCGIFQHLAEMLAQLALAGETKRLLALAAQRARRLAHQKSAKIIATAEEPVSRRLTAS